MRKKKQERKGCVRVRENNTKSIKPYLHSVLSVELHKLSRFCVMCRPRCSLSIGKAEIPLIDLAPDLCPTPFSQPRQSANERKERLLFVGAK